MLNPSPVESWGRLAGEAALLREGDLRRIGELDLMLSELAQGASEPAVAPNVRSAPAATLHPWE